MGQNNSGTSPDFDVIIIGGGITGAGTARDCAMRGLKTLLVERHDYATGATGRNHGLLHSGARYAMTDSESACECIKENMILRRIARHCVEETDGLFITLPEDDLSYQGRFIEACRAAGIRADEISPEEARILEPSVNPTLVGAVRVPDGSVDPFRLTISNIYDARLHGAQTLVGHEVIGFLRESDRIVGVQLLNQKNGERLDVRAQVTVNAAGIWGQHIAQMAGVTVSMFPAKGALLIFGHRVNKMVINRCRKPANADILVPGDTVAVIGTTSDRVPFETVDDMKVTPEEVDILLKEGMMLAPALATTRILRAYAGVRPLVAADNDPSGRNISRGIVCLNHEERDGLKGFVTITGGKLMTYRLMAEMATDTVCRKLGIDKKCQTASIPLPGSELMDDEELDPKTYAQKVKTGRYGTKAKHIAEENVDNNALVCECEEVTVGEVKHVIERMGCDGLNHLRKRTRLGMGTCQGALCALRAAGMMNAFNGQSKQTLCDLSDFLNERWKGMRPVAWGDTLNEAQLTSTIYQDLCGIDKFPGECKNSAQ